MESRDVRAAAVLGFASPIIAVQPALLVHLTDAELDQVVVHEWAHVARRDALGTLVQRVVHVLAGWHPAVWFAMGRLRMEREMACDEVVVDAHRIGQGVCDVPDARCWPGANLERIPFGRSDALVPRTDTPRHAAARLEGGRRHSLPNG